MKCEVCSNLLGEYFDGELAGHDARQVEAHLITCFGCSKDFAELTADQELFASYDSEIEVPSSLWNRVYARTFPRARPIVADSGNGWHARLAALFSMPSLAAAAALAIVVGVAYFNRQPSQSTTSVGSNEPGQVKSGAPGTERQQLVAGETSSKEMVRVSGKRQIRKRMQLPRNRSIDQSDVLSLELAYGDLEDQDTAKHIERTQNLLRSIRNFPVSDADDEVDVTYDKALSRRLLNENVVLRRDAEMRAKFPTKTLLSDLEPFLIDIANLPDHARPEDLRTIQERVEKTEIVAALSEYQGRATHNR